MLIVIMFVKNSIKSFLFSLKVLLEMQLGLCMKNEMLRFRPVF